MPWSHHTHGHKQVATNMIDLMSTLVKRVVSTFTTWSRRLFSQSQRDCKKLCINLSRSRAVIETYVSRFVSITVWSQLSCLNNREPDNPHGKVTTDHAWELMTSPAPTQLQAEIAYNTITIGSKVADTSTAWPGHINQGWIPQIICLPSLSKSLGGPTVSDMSGSYSTDTRPWWGSGTAMLLQSNNCFWSTLTESLMVKISH